MQRNSAQGPRMKSDENPFFCPIYTIYLETMVHVVIDSYFSLFLNSLKILNPRRSLIVPLSLPENVQ